MTTPTLPVRLLNAVSVRSVEPVPVAATKWCWQCDQRHPLVEFPDPGVRCRECMTRSSRVNGARLAIRFLRSDGPAPVRRLVAYRAVAAAVTVQAVLEGIDLTGCPIPDPTGAVS